MLLIATLLAATSITNRKDQIDAVAAAAVVLTGGFLVWYAWETRRLATEAARQNRLQVEPYVVLEPDGVYTFKIKNVGRGTAFNVNIPDVVVSAEEEVIVRFPDSTPVLVAGQAIGAPTTSFRAGREAGNVFTGHLGPEASFRLPVVIECQDADGAGYRFHQRVVPARSQAERGRLEIVGVERRGPARARCH